MSSEDHYRMFMRSAVLLTICAMILTCVSASIADQIHTAAARGDAAKLIELVNSNSKLLNAADNSGATPLHWAVAGNHIAAVESLLAMHADVNVRKANGVTPLHVAAGQGFLAITELLLCSGADINARDNYGRTAISLATYRHHQSVIDTLISHGAAPLSAPKASTSDNESTVNFIQTTVRGCPVNLVYANLKNPRVRVRAAIAKNGIGSGESFSSFMRRYQPTASINGTFFSTRNMVPVGDIVIDGKLAHFGGMGTGLCITEKNEVEFVQVVRNRHTNWKGYETVICCGPRLITNGIVCVNARSEGFRDPHVLGIARRTAVGLTNRGRLLMINTRSACSLYELALMMLELDCTDAINFDGGSSIAMHYRGKTISRPSRQLTNVLMVYEEAPAPRSARASKPNAGS